MTLKYDGDLTLHVVEFGSGDGWSAEAGDMQLQRAYDMATYACYVTHGIRGFTTVEQAKAWVVTMREAYFSRRFRVVSRRYVREILEVPYEWDAYMGGSYDD